MSKYEPLWKYIKENNKGVKNEKIKFNSSI